MSRLEYRARSPGDRVHLLSKAFGGLRRAHITHVQAEQLVVAAPESLSHHSVRLEYRPVQSVDDDSVVCTSKRARYLRSLSRSALSAWWRSLMSRVTPRTPTTVPSAAWMG